MPWDFGDRRDPESLIPAGLDVLVSHEPPHGILDWSAYSRDDRLGNIALAKRVEEAKPRVHSFGHCHMAHGHVKIGSTHYVNVAVCGDSLRYYAYARPATIIDIVRDSITVDQSGGRR
jgi:Icc-related predicted phosphoesterase